MSNRTDKTVRVDSESHRRAKIEAAKEGKTLMEWLADVIRKATGNNAEK
jgi:predicted HicB family RNase H-like nuclease